MRRATLPLMLLLALIVTPASAQALPAGKLIWRTAQELAKRGGATGGSRNVTRVLRPAAVINPASHCATSTCALVPVLDGVAGANNVVNLELSAQIEAAARYHAELIPASGVYKPKKLDLGNKGVTSHKNRDSVRRRNLRAVYGRGNTPSIERLEEIFSSPSTGVTSKLADVSASSTRVSYEFTLMKDGEKVGDFDFDIIRRGKHLDIYIDYASLTKEAQNGGTFLDLMISLEDLAHTLGVRKFTLEASMSVGAYAWGRYGFTFELASERASIRRDVKAALRQAVHERYGQNEVSKRILDPLMRQLDEMQHAHEFAAFQWNGIRVGRRAMLGEDWDGIRVRSKDDPGQQAVLRYFAERLAQRAQQAATEWNALTEVRN